MIGKIKIRFVKQKHLNLINLRQAKPRREMEQNPIIHKDLHRSPRQWENVIKQARMVCSDNLIYISDDSRRNLVPNQK